MKPLTFVNRKKTKQTYIKINNQLPGSSSSSSCVVFSLSTFTLMIDRTLRLMWRSAIPWRLRFVPYYHLLWVAVILLLAISSASTLCFALWRSFNSFFGGRYSKCPCSLSRGCHIIWQFLIKDSCYARKSRESYALRSWEFDIQTNKNRPVNIQKT